MSLSDGTFGEAPGYLVEGIIVVDLIFSHGVLHGKI
jgi:hypothetical protein